MPGSLRRSRSPLDQGAPMILLHPRHLDRRYPDERSAEVMRRTVEFFGGQGPQSR